MKKLNIFLTIIVLTTISLVLASDYGYDSATNQGGTNTNTGTTLIFYNSTIYNITNNITNYGSNITYYINNTTPMNYNNIDMLNQSNTFNANLNQDFSNNNLTTTGTGTFGINKDSTTFGLLVGNAGNTAVPSSVVTTQSGTGSMIAVEGNNSAYFMGRDITNAIEFIMGTSTTGTAFAGSMTNHPFQLRTGNIARWYISTTGNLVNSNGYNITNVSYICNQTGSCFSLSELNRTGGSGSGSMNYTNIAMLNQSDNFQGNYIYNISAIGLRRMSTEGYGVSFNGINQYINATLRMNPATYPNLTMILWVYPLAYSSQIQILGFDGSSGNNQRNIGMQGGTYQIQVGTQRWDTGVPVTLGVWQQVAVVFSVGNVLFFKDGSGYSRGVGGSFSGDTTAPLQIGNNAYGGGSQWFSGKMDELQVYNRSLGSTEISTLYNSGSGTCGVSGSGLVLGYHFENNYTDYSGNGYTGINQGSNFIQSPKAFCGMSTEVITNLTYDDSGLKCDGIDCFTLPQFPVSYWNQTGNKLYPANETWSIQASGGTTNGIHQFAISGGQTVGEYSTAESVGLSYGYGSHTDSGGVTSYGGIYAHADTSGYATEQHSKADTGGTSNGQYSYGGGRGTSGGTNSWTFGNGIYNPFDNYLETGQAGFGTANNVNQVTIKSPDTTDICAGTLSDCNQLLDSTRCGYISGCSWGICSDSPSLDCSIYNEGDCLSRSFCSPNYDNLCSGADETTCIADSCTPVYAGDCSVLGETACGSTGGCSQHFDGDCSSAPYPDCVGWTGCSDQGSSCAGNYYTSCSGGYYSSCSGTDNVWNSCSNNGACSSIDYASCNNYNGCASTEACSGSILNTDCNQISNSDCSNTQTSTICTLDHLNDTVDLSVQAGVGQLNDTIQCLDSSGTKQLWTDYQCNLNTGNIMPRDVDANNLGSTDNPFANLYLYNGLYFSYQSEIHASPFNNMINFYSYGYGAESINVSGNTYTKQICLDGNGGCSYNISYDGSHTLVLGSGTDILTKALLSTNNISPATSSGTYNIGQSLSTYRYTNSWIENTFSNNETTQNITVSGIIKLNVGTLPACNSVTNGSISRNRTATYGCNNTGQWVKLF